MAFFWSIVVLAILVNNCTTIAMKMEVNETLPAGQRFSWWNRDGRQVSRKYLQIHPESYLPILERCSFWAVVVLGLTFIVATYRS
jgi:hypothetical protein